MKKRSIGLVILLSFITCGIYTLFWLADTRREMVARGAKIPNVSLLFLPLLSIVAVTIVQFFLHFVIGPSVSGFDPEAVSDYGSNTPIMVVSVLSITVGVIAFLALIPVALYWFYKYCQGVELVTRKQVSFGLSYGLWLLLAVTSLSFIWPGIIQDGFNKVTTKAPKLKKTAAKAKA
jgi:hypothetical protein